MLSDLPNPKPQTPNPKPRLRVLANTQEIILGGLAIVEARESLCVHCNKCLPTIYTGTRCVLTDL